MSTFLLIHGGWSAGWVWDTIKAALQAEGHTVLAPDLPGHGSNPLPISEVTLERYALATAEFASSLSGKVILVGHSMSGLINAQAAEYTPEKFKAIVYMTAFLPADGQCLMDLAEPDTENLVLRNIIYSEDGLSMDFNEDALVEAIYADCSDEDIARSMALTRPQASAPFREPVRLTKERSGSIPRYYISCTQDRAITPDSQKKMYTANPCEKVFTIEASHAVYYSKPYEVATCLSSISDSLT